MAEEQRRLLEQLMGKEALISPASRRREVEMTSHRVCSSFLVGTCPHDLFVGTKQDLGKCPLLHLEKHKMEYEYRVSKGERFPDIEYNHYNNLKKYIIDLDRTIEFAQRRLERTPEEKQKIAEVTKELDELDTQIGLMSEEINLLIAENHTLKATSETIKLNQLCQQRETLSETARNLAENVGQTSQQKLQVCEACGAYLSRLDSDRRLADHLIGKIHLGYVQMRQAYDELNHRFKRSHI